jgi:hypothetical protein
MEKLVRDGKVAVLVSTDWGSGWFVEKARFDPTLVQMLEAGASKEQLSKYCTETYPGEWLGGLSALEVQWVTQGEYFYVHEYDGSEWIAPQKDFYIA